jgi:predicted enzyme related to lactoylglutathione lyase
MILGLRTAIYPTPDLSIAKDWYRQVLQCNPYFDEPFYVGFSVGGFELGLVPDGQPGIAGVQAYWGVDNAELELERLENLGARIHEPLKNVGGDILVASVLDPFGNRFCIIQNPHFKREDAQ